MKKLALGIFASTLMLLSVFAISSTVSADAACSQAALADSSFCQGKSDDFRSFATSITNMLLFLIGTAAVIMIIIGGIKYSTADGDAGKITSAKNNILYSVIGLIVALMAWGIVTFVITRSTAGNTGQAPAPTTPTGAGGANTSGGAARAL